MSQKLADLFINNQWLVGEGVLIHSYNPATQQLLWEGHGASLQQADDAVLSARHAFTKWSLMSFEERTDILREFNHQLEKNQTDLSEIIAKETGKPLWEASTEVSTMVAKLSISIEAFHDRTGLHVKTSQDIQQITRHKPHGVMAVLGPYNFPGHLPNGHIIPALLAGNTVIFKPSEFTPLTAQTIISCWQAAHLPAGVINLLQGGKEVGMALAKHTGVNGLLFTGSYATGKWLHQQFADYPEKILALEMGGNNPLVIGDIQHTEAAIYLTLQSVFLTAGQRCTCAKRLIVVDNKINRGYLDELVSATKRLHVGLYNDDPQPFMGALISDKAVQQVLTKQQQLVQQGGNILLAAAQLVPNTGLMSPGIIDVTAIKDLPDEEIFGPLLQVIWVENMQQAIKVANQTRYGLVAGIFSENEAEYMEFYSFVNAGIINWNRPTTGASSAAPFGGIGHSGNHRPSAYYAADYSAYPVASNESSHLSLPANLLPGIVL